ncbi:MAG: inositol monophosphatase family protein [Thermoleophilia bacterium]
MPDGGPGPRDQEWLAAARRACGRIGEAVRPLTSAERREPQGRGAGGDTTVRVDRLAEDIVLEELGALGMPLRVLSEEAGMVALGGAGAGDPLVVVDPIDGSLNAKRGLPLFATSIALAGGPAMGDVRIGLVHDHGSGEEWLGVRGEGSWVDGVALAPAPPPDGRLPIVLLEGASPRRVGRAAEALDGRTGRIRALGSLALSLCHVAGGRGDAMAGMGPGRSVDVAAAQLIAREAGVLVGMPGTGDLAGTPLDLDGRFGVTAAHDEAAIDLLRGLTEG